MTSFYQYFVITIVFFMLVQFAIIFSFSVPGPQELQPPQPSRRHMLQLWSEVDHLKQKLRTVEDSLYALEHNTPTAPHLPPKNTHKPRSKSLPKPLRSNDLSSRYGDNVLDALENQQKAFGQRAESRATNAMLPVRKEEAKKDKDPLDGEKYPDRSITFADFAEIKLKKTAWSVVPEEAQGKLCLRKWNPQEQALAFIHIGKAAGTTMDSLLGTAKFKGLPRCSGFRRKSVNSASLILRDLRSWDQRCPVCFFCGAHNDYHYLEEVEKEEGVEFLMDKIAPVSWIREPAAREVSQFYFAQKKTRVIDKNFRFSDWIWKMALHPETIRGTNSLFADGSSGVMWFSGTVADVWVNSGMKNAEQIWKKMRRRLLHAPIETLRDAVLNHNKFMWVGIVENWDNSVALLEGQGDVQFAKSKTVANKNPNKGATEAEKELLRMAYPMDAAFYEYARQVNRMKWELYSDAVDKGTLDDIWCKSNAEARDFTIPFFFNGTRIV